MAVFLLIYVFEHYKSAGKLCPPFRGIYKPAPLSLTFGAASDIVPLLNGFDEDETEKQRSERDTPC